ncbi:MAG: metalloregulator ArsR/SmtB family transcription factor [Planctomycetota bacterium]
MTVETLRQAFKTLADPTRMRLLLLLEREELAVHELMEVLGMAQSTVSRHLGILRDAGLLRDRREGTSVCYRFAPLSDGPWQDVWAMAKRSLGDDPTTVQDQAALESILQARTLRTKSWFDAVAPDWDSLRRVFNDDIHRAKAVAKLVPDGLHVADIGTGTGILAQELSAAGLQVTAVDHSDRMLDAARSKLRAAGAEGVELRRGDAGNLPLADGEVDAAFAHMVLHYVASPADAVREMARITKASGRVVAVDFVQHDRDWMRERLGVLWQGFPLDTVREWFEGAGLVGLTIEVDEGGARNDVPATFIACARKPNRRVER